MRKGYAKPTVNFNHYANFEDNNRIQIHLLGSAPTFKLLKAVQLRCCIAYLQFSRGLFTYAQPFDMARKSAFSHPKHSGRLFLHSLAFLQGIFDHLIFGLLQVCLYGIWF